MSKRNVLRVGIHKLNGHWSFRWCDLSNLLTRDVVGPLGSQEEAALAMEAFIEDRRRDHPLDIFERDR